MDIGEGMSKVTDLATIVEGTNGELYESNAHWISGRPLDFGRSLYVKLRRAFPDDVEVEVLWDHYTDILLAIVESDGERTMEHIGGEHAVRADRVHTINKFVEAMQGRVDG